MFEYKTKEEHQLKQDYYRRNRAGLNGFENYEAFRNWYHNQKKRVLFLLHERRRNSRNSDDGTS